MLPCARPNVDPNGLIWKKIPSPPPSVLLICTTITHQKLLKMTHTKCPLFNPPDLHFTSKTPQMLTNCSQHKVDPATFPRSPPPPKFWPSHQTLLVLQNVHKIATVCSQHMQTLMGSSKKLNLSTSFVFQICSSHQLYPSKMFTKTLTACSQHLQTLMGWSHKNQPLHHLHPPNLHFTSTSLLRNVHQYATACSQHTQDPNGLIPKSSPSPTTFFLQICTT